MPQLGFENIHDPYGFRAHYWVDPLKPLADGHLAVETLNRRSQPLDVVALAIPANVCWEMVSDVLRLTWGAYLFGEAGDLRGQARHAAKEWRRESRKRP